MYIADILVFGFPLGLLKEMTPAGNRDILYVERITDHLVSRFSTLRFSTTCTGFQSGYARLDAPRKRRSH
jgi:hypothetical protein